MRLTRRLASAKKATTVALSVVAGTGALSLAITSALAAPKPPTPPPPATTTTTTVVDSTPPPPPVLAEKPDNPTTSKNAHFKVTDAEAGVTFECRLNGGAWGACGPVANYNGLDYGEHCLDVRALDRAGNTSPATGWCWSIVIQGGFPISGTVPQPFAPGVSHPLNLVLGNPYNFTIRVTSVTIAVDTATTNADCVGPTNLTVTKNLSAPVDVPRDATRSLQQLGVAQADWPVLTMPNLPVNQDACKGVTFSLSFTGQATKP